MSMTKANLTQAYVRAERWGDAEVLLKDLLHIVPKDHPDYIVATLGYIYVLTATARTAEAEAHCLRVLDVISKDKVLSADSPRTVAIAEQLALIYMKQERQSELEALRARYPSINQSGRRPFNIWLV